MSECDPTYPGRQPRYSKDGTECMTSLSVVSPTGVVAVRFWVVPSPNRRVAVPGQTATNVNDHVRVNTAVVTVFHRDASYYMVRYYDWISLYRSRSHAIIYRHKEMQGGNSRPLDLNSSEVTLSSFQRPSAILEVIFHYIKYTLINF